MKNQKGFTLIELVMVILLLGILAAVAIPRFFDLGTRADQAAAEGGIGGIMSGASTLLASQAVFGTYNSVYPYPANPLSINVVTGLYSKTAGVGTPCSTLAQGQWGVDATANTTVISYRWRSDASRYSSWGYTSASGLLTTKQDSASGTCP